MDNEKPTRAFGPFVPVLLLALSMLVWEAWNLSAALRQRAAGARLRDQQQQQMVQAADVENKLKQVMVGLLDLSQHDPDAATIVRTFGIALNAPAASATPGGGTP